MKVPFTTFKNDFVHNYFLVLSPIQPVKSPIEYRVIASNLPTNCIPDVRIGATENKDVFDVYIPTPDGSKPDPVYRPGVYFTTGTGHSLARDINRLVMRWLYEKTGNCESTELTVTVLSTHPKVIK